VTDSLKITFRTGPSNKRKIISILYSGQPLEVLESQGDWSRVRLLGNGQDNNEEGWVLSQYLMTRLPWEMLFKSLFDENTQLKEKLTPIEENLLETARREKEREKKLQETTKALRELEGEYESLKKDFAEFLTVKTSHLTTLSKLEAVQKDFEALSEDYKKLRYSEWKKWFSTGAGVLLLGLMIGLILGKKQKKTRLSWY
jgi:SH3 domain protein